MSIPSLSIGAYTAVSALGAGRATMLNALQQQHSGLRRCDFEDADIDTWIGRVEGLEHSPLSAEFAAYDCRNNRLAWQGLIQDGFDPEVDPARDRYGAHRIGVFIGTSTSGILSTEQAYRDRDPDSGMLPDGLSYRHTHDIAAVAEFCRDYLALTGPAHGLSTACSSSAKVFAEAWRYIQAGLIDAAVVGGVDSLCLTTLYGFRSLGLTSADPCRPWAAGRDGLSLGEAAGFLLLERPGHKPAPQLLGYGESSDAYHMSNAHPEGLGAEAAMSDALRRAGLQPAQIDYINLHGTATPANDAAEDRAVSRLFGTATPCSSTKGWTGHTLGAAGALEAVLTLLCLEHDLLPVSLNTDRLDPELQAAVVLDPKQRLLQTAMSNSFGFGGSNCSLIFGTGQ